MRVVCGYVSKDAQQRQEVEVSGGIEVEGKQRIKTTRSAKRMPKRHAPLDQPRRRDKLRPLLRLRLPQAERLRSIRRPPKQTRSGRPMLMLGRRADRLAVRLR